MEFCDLGKHCEQCRIQDYLPFICTHCNRYFCKEHMNNHDNCLLTEEQRDSKNNYIVCPLNSCKIQIDISKNNDSEYLNEIVDKHIRENKCLTKPKVYKCKLCKSTSTIRNKCRNCGKNYCLRHRFPEIHNCLKDNKIYK